MGGSGSDNGIKLEPEPAVEVKPEPTEDPSASRNRQVVTLYNLMGRPPPDQTRIYAPARMTRMDMLMRVLENDRTPVPRLLDRTPCPSSEVTVKLESPEPPAPP